jgi:hypothetical protein
MNIVLSAIAIRKKIVCSGLRYNTILQDSNMIFFIHLLVVDTWSRRAFDIKLVRIHRMERELSSLACVSRCVVFGTRVGTELLNLLRVSICLVLAN